jgi:hypothetical protein
MRGQAGLKKVGADAASDHDAGFGLAGGIRRAFSGKTFSGKTFSGLRKK